MSATGRRGLLDLAILACRADDKRRRAESSFRLSERPELERGADQFVCRAIRTSSKVLQCTVAVRGKDSIKFNYRFEQLKTIERGACDNCFWNAAVSRRQCRTGPCRGALVFSYV